MTQPGFIGGDRLGLDAAWVPAVPGISAVVMMMSSSSRALGDDAACRC